MRTPKYKAWHKAEKVMCDVSVINFDKGAFLIGVKKGEDEYYDKSFVPAPDNGRFCDWDEIELLEWTGLLDKNGVEVFEGNILKEHGIVAWNNVEHRWSAIDLNWNDRREWHDIDYLTSPFEIIGSIHANPELL